MDLGSWGSRLGSLNAMAYGLNSIHLFELSLSDHQSWHMTSRIDSTVVGNCMTGDHGHFLGVIY